jgi:hypothetical protein
MNLTASNDYTVPLNIDDFHSRMIYSNNDGGSQGVFRRLRVYLEYMKNVRISNKQDTTAIDIYINELDTAAKKAKRVRFSLK